MENMKTMTGDMQINIFITKSTQHGLYSLINWIEGFTAKGGEVPGGFELVMHFQELQSAIEKVKGE